MSIPSFRSRRARCVAALAAASCIPVAAFSAPAVSAGPVPGPLAGPGSYLGVFQLGPDGGAVPTATSVQAQLGRRFGVERIYTNWDNPEPTPGVSAAASAGVVPILSIASQLSSGKSLAWSSIAAGADDAAIQAQAAGLRSVGAPVILTLDHEPELMGGKGSASDFVAAFRHYVSVFRASGATNVTFALITGQPVFVKGQITSWYPGDDVVDWVAADGYNSYGCVQGNNPVWQSFSTIFTPVRTFAEAHGKPILIPEWASTEQPGNPAAKAQWITDATATLASWSDVRAAIYFDAPGHAGARCNWPLTSSSASLGAFAAAAAGPAFSAFPQAWLTPTTGTTGAAPLAVGLSTAGTATGTGAPASWTLSTGGAPGSTSGTGTPPAAVSLSYGPGEYAATLRVTDAYGRWAAASAQVQVLPPPVCSRGAITWTGPASVSLAGKVDTEGLATTVSFEYGPTTAYGSSTTAVTVPAGSGFVAVSGSTPALGGKVTYHYRMVATNASGTTVTADSTFTVH